MKVAAVDARDQRRLGALPAGGDGGAPLPAGAVVGCGSRRVSRGAGVAGGRRDDVEDDPMTAPALPMKEARLGFK